MPRGTVQRLHPEIPDAASLTERVYDSFAVWSELRAAGKECGIVSRVRIEEMLHRSRSRISFQIDNYQFAD